jgi:septin family protein
LQQLVELTKKFYVQRRQEQIADNETCRQAAKPSDSEKDQSRFKAKEINKEFDKIKEDIRQIGEVQKH